MDLTVDFEELRQTAALHTALEALRVDHAARMDSLQTGVTSANEGLLELSADHREWVKYADDTFAIKVEQKEVCEQLHRDSLRLHQELVAACEGIEALDTARHSLVKETDLLKRRIEELELSSKVSSTCLDSLRQDITALDRDLRQDLATKTMVEYATQSLADVHTKLDFAALDRASIREEMLKECSLAVDRYSASEGRDRKHVFSQLSEISHASTELWQLLDAQAKQMDHLANRQTAQQQVLENLSIQQTSDINHLEDMCSSLHAEFHTQACNVQKTADSLSLSSTRVSMEQMEQTLGLKHSLDELSRDHEQLKMTVHG